MSENTEHRGTSSLVQSSEGIKCYTMIKMNNYVLLKVVQGSGMAKSKLTAQL